MTLMDSLSRDQYLLAHQTAAKLGKVMHGIMSVGTGCLELPTPLSFLAGRDRLPLTLIETLRQVGATSSNPDLAAALTRQTRLLSDKTIQFHREFLHLAHWRTRSVDEVQSTVNRLGDSYVQFCQQLSDFCSQLGMNLDFSEQAVRDRAMLEALFDTKHIREQLNDRMIRPGVHEDSALKA